jgi:hypothetical protein
VPLKKGKSKATLSKNIREFHKGKTYSRTRKKFGKKKANKQAVAVAFAQRRRSK